jgi:hypothetical protein
MIGSGGGRPTSPARIFPARGGGKLANWDRTTEEIMEATGTTGWTRHDLRRTGAATRRDGG